VAAARFVFLTSEGLRHSRGSHGGCCTQGPATPDERPRASGLVDQRPFEHVRDVLKARVSQERQ